MHDGKEHLCQGARGKDDSDVASTEQRFRSTPVLDAQPAMVRCNAKVQSTPEQLLPLGRLFLPRVDYSFQEAEVALQPVDRWVCMQCSCRACAAVY